MRKKKKKKNAPDLSENSSPNLKQSPRRTAHILHNVADTCRGMFHILHKVGQVKVTPLRRRQQILRDFPFGDAWRCSAADKRTPLTSRSAFLFVVGWFVVISIVYFAMIHNRTGGKG
ncbi:hypothetical protein CEXT_513511 [Caerostris extrusa]|uniref:Transmembrane protein n=1 Tax=Caerostris extrusa TaxID=172846 RepID=A0AAV4U6I4_CAEEX|nr:hypothetical protein CEXT_513511 [Caerostris extrusa]